MLSLVAMEGNRLGGSKSNCKDAGTPHGDECIEREAGGFKAHFKRKIMRLGF